MKADLKQLIEIASGCCDKIFRESGEVLPMWHTIDAKGRHGIYATPIIDKDALASGMRQLIAEDNIVRFVFITEAWTTASTTADAKAASEWMQSGKSLEDFPGRKEVVMFSAEDGDGNMIANRPIIRNQGKPKLGPLEWFDDVIRPMGRFTDMFPRKPETAH